MAISTDYPAPVNVNGFSCRNCTDVDRAKKHIDPANPSAGPFGVNGDTPDARATTHHFSPEARDRDALAQAHRKQTQIATNSIAAAYGSAGAGPVSGQNVNISA